MLKMRVKLTLFAPILCFGLAQAIEDLCIFQSKMDSVGFLNKPGFNTYREESIWLKNEPALSLFRLEDQTIVGKDLHHTRIGDVQPGRVKSVTQPEFITKSLYRTRYPTPHQCIFQSKMDSVGFLNKPDFNTYREESIWLKNEPSLSLYRPEDQTIVEKDMHHAGIDKVQPGRVRSVKKSGFIRLSLYRTRNPPAPPPPPPCSYSPCQHGTCSNSGSSYSCACTAGYAGTQCQTDIDECASSPCQNEATCEDQVNGYICHCGEDYTGLQCETDMCLPSQGADITFIVDTSSSQGQGHLQRKLDFIKSLVSTFPIGVNDFRFSLISVSDIATLNFDLNTHLTNVTLLDAIDNLRQTNGTSNVHDALNVARNDVFGNVIEVKSRYIITLSDGIYNDQASTLSEAIQAKLAGVTLLSVGFGDQILHQALTDVSTDYRYVFPPTTADLTHWFSRRHAMDACPDCSTQYSDILILLETSRDLGLPLFYRLYNAVTARVRNIPIGQNKAHVSFATFDSAVTEKFDFVTYYSRNDVIKITTDSQVTDETSNYTNAFQYVKDNAFTSSKGYRSGSRKIVILFMSEVIPDMDSVKGITDAIKSDDVTIVVVTSLTQIMHNITSLQEIVSDPAYLFVLEDRIYGSNSAPDCLSTLFEYNLCIFD